MKPHNNLEHRPQVVGHEVDGRSDHPELFLKPLATVQKRIDAAHKGVPIDVLKPRGQTLCPLVHLGRDDGLELLKDHLKLFGQKTESRSKLSHRRDPDSVESLRQARPLRSEGLHTCDVGVRQGIPCGLHGRFGIPESVGSLTQDRQKLGAGIFTKG